MFPGTQNAGQSIGSHPIIAWFREWPTRTPFITQMFLGSISLFFFLRTLLSLDTWPFLNITSLTWGSLELYRPLLNFHLVLGLLDWLLTFGMFSLWGVQVEKTLGSFQYLVLLLTLASGMNVVFNLSMTSFAWVALSFGYPDYVSMFMSFPIGGASLLLYALFTYDCVQVPDTPRQYVCVVSDLIGRSLSEI